MRISRFLLRSLSYYWRTNLAMIAGVATAVSVLAGALLVGESVRASLRDLVLERLGNADYVLTANGFFREDLSHGIASHRDFQANFNAACPVIFLQGVVINERSGLRAHQVNVYGVDARFWNLQERNKKAPQGREVLLGESLARELSAQPSDALLLRIEKQEGIPKESLYGSREDTGRTVRLTCREILPAEELGEFSLEGSQGNIHSLFVPLERLQNDLGQASNVNAVLISASNPYAGEEILRRILRESFTLQDLGIKLRLLESRRVLSVESTRILLGDPLAEAAYAAASKTRMRVSGVYTYLANSIRAGSRSIPYSVITAADISQGSLTGVRLLEGSFATNQDSSIWLNEWARKDLGASPGDTISIDYYLWQDEGRLATATAQFKLAGVVALEGDVSDPTLAPEFPGISEARSVSDWDPPFPIDLNRIRSKDEDYWNRYKTTPKAFISLPRGQELWKTRFGQLSSIRLTPDPGLDLKDVSGHFEENLRSRLDPERSGFAIRPVKAQGLAAARGSTDFGQYFVYFSFFLIAAAILLAGLFFRLGVEQRAQEIGTLSASGFSRSTIRNLVLIEGILVSATGSALGLLGSMAYAWLLLLGLRTWWLGAVGTQQIFLHLSWLPLVLGAIAGITAAILTVASTLRGLSQISPRALLAGFLESQGGQKWRTRRIVVIAAAASALGLLLLAGTFFGILGHTAGFFGAGSLSLVALLSLIALELGRKKGKTLIGKGWPAVIRLAARNASYRPARSLLCIALIASASFVIVSVEAFRHDPEKVSLEKTSGTGGFPLYATSVLPLVHDINSKEGKEALNLSPAESAALESVTFIPFRLRPGQDISCLNLYTPQEPRILGAPRGIIESGRFSFQDSLPKTPEERTNPWRLLEATEAQGAVPAIADAKTIQYTLHLDLGKDVVVRRSDGGATRLRLVAALKESIFQGELIISESNFLRVFPEQQGYRFFLVDTLPEKISEVTRVLEEGLADFGTDVSPTRERLAAYQRVENTYLSTFQALGGLGLVLGTVGLATVLLRNVLERRQELALLRAVGFRKGVLAGLVIGENAVLMIFGLLSGAACAFLAITPALLSRGGGVSLVTLALTLGAVLVIGFAASFLAVIAAFRTPLLPALRGE